MQLREMCCITMGQSPNSDSYNEEREGVPFFQGNADFGERYPNVRTWCKEPKKMAKNGDVLISVRAPIGAINYAREICCIGRGLAALSPKTDKVSKEFIFWVMKSRCKELQMKGTGSTFKAISKKILEEVKIPLYPLEKQIEYSLVLEKVYAIIETYKSELQKLDELIQARFVELFGDPVINSKNLRTMALKDVLRLKAGDFTAASDISDKLTETNKYPCFGGNGIRGYVTEYNQEGEYSLIGRQGALSGNVQFAKGKFRNTEHALLVIPMVEMNDIWLNQLLINLDLKRYQTGAAQPGLSVKNLQEISIIMVPITEQNQFADFVNQVHKSKLVIKNLLQIYKHQIQM